MNGKQSTTTIRSREFPANREQARHQHIACPDLSLADRSIQGNITGGDMIRQPVYFDNNATTRVAPEVLEAMLPFLEEFWGNPSSAYLFGHQLGSALDTARANVAELIKAEPREIIFTSCGTESNNTALHSALSTRSGKRHIVTTGVEHSATLKYCTYLQKQGFEVTYLAVNGNGALDLAEVENAITDQTALVSVMLANNETGILFPVREVAEICKSKNILCHTDAVQAAGKIKLDVNELGVDLLSLSAHKIYAPKGIGALYVKRHTKFQPYIIGGGQERGRRGGTENVPYMVAFGRAAELANARVDQLEGRVRKLRDDLEAGLLSKIPGSAVNGPKEPRLPNTSNIAFSGVEAEGMLLLLDQAGVCVSSGSACTTGSLDPSHVLVAMGYSAARARSSIRFSLGYYSSEEDVSRVLECLPGIIEKLRESAPVPDFCSA